jgi:hypothetical protein
MWHWINRGHSMALLVTFGVVAAVCLSVASLSPAAQKDDQSLRAFMRKKLDASSRILEGLTTEDDFAIKEGAAALLEMSKAEMWNVIVDEDYREFNREFRGSVRKLSEAAEKENFDNATLQWFDTVKACVECHKYVRSARANPKK